MNWFERKCENKRKYQIVDKKEFNQVDDRVKEGLKILSDDSEKLRTTLQLQ